MQVLAAAVNRFNGVEIDPAHLPADPGAFGTALRDALVLWQQEGRQVAWLEVPIQQAALIPVAVAAGFTFHHSGSDYLMLTRALCAGAHVPAHATHYIGAGGVVLNAAGELLVVVERFYRTPGQPPRFKLPGGALLAGEHLVDGVQREIREETGIETAFEALICLRHWHGYRYGKSDIYFVSRLRALTTAIHRQEAEIAACRWMPVGEYLGDPNVSPFNRRVVEAALSSPGLPTATIDGYGDASRYEIFLPPPESPGGSG